MRRLLVLASALLVAAGVSDVADASHVTDCWTETVLGADFQPVTVTACLLAGGTIEVYTSGERPPVLPDINLGYDALGTECWWKTAVDTPWVKVEEYSDGVAWVGYRPPGSPGTVLDALIRSCTSRPRESDNTLASAWQLANRHVHEVPAPAFNPDVGITGFETFLEVAVPDPITDSLVSPLGTTVAVEIKVGKVVVDWGDGTIENFTESAYPRLTGYPNGLARHVYETKTCPAPGGHRCHPTLTDYEIRVEYDWFVQWRVDAGAWSTIAVPNTTTSVSYDVDEIVTRSVTSP